MNLIADAKMSSPALEILVVEDHADTLKYLRTYLTKPFTPDLLDRLLEEAVSERSLRGTHSEAGLIFVGTSP